MGNFSLLLLAYYRLRNSLRERVAIFNPFAFTCNPLSEVSKIGLLSLNLRATERILLSGDFLLKSFGNNDESDNSIDTLGRSKDLLILRNAFSTLRLSSLSSVILSLSSSSITFADNTTEYFESILEIISG